MSLTAGARLGPYEILDLLGSGGMGEVYQARDTRLDRIVAVKVLGAALASDPQFRERFDREARAISQLTHPHICRLYDVGEHEGSAFLVLEFLEGETLAARLGRTAIPRTNRPAAAETETKSFPSSVSSASYAVQRPSPLPLSEALTIAIQIADALAAAHRAGIVHRDLKPGNVMIVRAGGPSGAASAKLLDFGLAKSGPSIGGPASAPVALSALTASPTLASPLTTQGSIVGTLLYMSPEQLQGVEADARSDIFAFGAVVYEMLTGVKAFSGKSQVSVMAAILDHDPPALTALQPTTPAALDRIVRKCLAKDPEARWQSARDLQSELEWIAESVSQPTSAAETAGTKASTASGTVRRPWRWMAASVALPVLATAITWAVTHSAPAPKVQPMRFAIVPPAAQSLAPTNTDRQLAISPDGRNIVYVAGASTANLGPGQLVVRAIDRLDAEPLRGVTAARFPFISPDGKWIGFFTLSELRKVSITGGPSIALCRVDGAPRGASWGPDDTVVFATADQGTGLLSVPAGGGEPKVLTKPDVAHGEQDHLLPSVLPGGRAVLFTIAASTGPIDNAQVAVLDLKTGQRKILIRGGNQAEYVDPSTSSGQAPSTGSGQAGYLVYASAGTLRAVRFDPVKLEVLSDPAPVVEQVGMMNTGAAEFAVSRTGALVFIPGLLNIAGGGGLRSLVWVNRQGREEPIKAPPRAYFALRLSPDGTRVALDVRDQDSDIWVWDLARQTLTRLTFAPGPDIFPVWTPDSRRIVFSSVRDGSTPNLFWQPADGAGNLERLSTSAIAQFANAFLPDGTQLMFQDGGTGTTAGDNPTADISVRAMDGRGKPVPLIQTKFIKRNADVSPDGRWVAYESNDSGQFQIYVQPFPNVTGGRWQVSTAGGTKPIWARSGRELFYVDGSSALMAVPVQTTTTFSAGNPAKLLEAKYFHGVQQSRSYDVSRDGQRFLMIKDTPADSQKPTDTPAGMVVVLNWTEELRQRLPAK